MLLQNEDIIKLLIAILVGSIIGAEREYRDKVAGLRTNIFICVGATIFALLSSKFGAGADPTRIAANIVSGVGFLGAGAILRERGRVVGLTTAATIWLTAALGMGIAVGEYVLVAGTTIVMLAVLLIFPYVESAIGRLSYTRIYKIAFPVECDDKKLVAELLKDCRLRTWDHIRSKREKTIRVSFTASGRGAAHEKFMSKMFDADSVLEYSVM